MRGTTELPLETNGLADASRPGHLALPPRDRRAGAALVQLTRLYSLLGRHRIAPLAALEPKRGPKPEIAKRSCVRYVPSSCDSRREAARRRQVFDGGSLGEPAQVKSVRSAHTGSIADAELTSFECSKGWRHATDGRQRRKERRGSLVWEHEGERKKTRGGASYEVMHTGRARASRAAPISQRRCVRFLMRKTRQADNTVEH